MKKWIYIYLTLLFSSILLAQNGLRNPIVLASSNQIFEAGAAETNAVGRPESLTDNTGVWTTSPLWSDLDDIVGQGDASVVSSDASPVTTEPFTVKLSDTLDPAASDNHFLRMRSSLLGGAAANYDIICELREGYVNESTQGTLIAGVTNLDMAVTAYVTAEWELTATQTDAITDYTDLHCRCYAGKNGGGGNDTVRIADIEFQVQGPEFFYFASETTIAVGDHLDLGNNISAVDTNKVLISFWAKMGAGSSDTDAFNLFSNDTANWRVRRVSNGAILFYMQINGGAIQWSMTTDTNVLTIAKGWTHVMAMYDGSTQTEYCYADGVDVVNNDTTGTSNWDWTSSSKFTIYNALGKDFALCELWINYEAFDLSQATNRDKFYDSVNDKPVFLGTDGSTPTGTQPLVYLPLPYSQVMTNAGSAGDFVMTGTLGDMLTDVP